MVKATTRHLYLFTVIAVLRSYSVKIKKKTIISIPTPSIEWFQLVTLYSF